MSMIFGMATRKVTITLDERDVARVKSMVADGKSASVSAFVQHAVTIALSDAELWDETFEEWLAATGGPLTTAERAIADELLDRPVGDPTPPEPRDERR